MKIGRLINQWDIVIKIKKIISITFIVGVMLIAVGCTTKKVNSTVCKYEQKSIVNGLTLSKSVYQDDTLTIYHDGSLSANYEVISVSTDNNNDYMDNNEWEYEVNDRKIIITFVDAEDINSIVISDESGNNEYHLRWLNTDQYAALYYVFADDIGMDLCDGDETLYYTDEELEARAQKQAKYKQEQERIWNRIEGYYESEILGEFLHFITSENGIRYAYLDGEYKIVCGIEDFDGCISVICEAGGLQIDMEFNLSDDGRYIEDEQTIEVEGRYATVSVRYNKTEQKIYDDEQKALFEQLIGRWRPVEGSRLGLTIDDITIYDSEFYEELFCVFDIYEEFGQYFLKTSYTYHIVDIAIDEGNIVVICYDNGIKRTLSFSLGTEETEGMIFFEEIEVFFENIE